MLTKQTGRYFLFLLYFLLTSPFLYTQTITTIAGTGVLGYSGDGGPAIDAQFNWPSCITLDPVGNIYIVDFENYYIRKIDIGTGRISSIAGIGTNGYSGDNGPATEAELDHPHGMALDKDGNIYIADQYSNRIRKITKSTGIITTIAGTGSADYTGDDGQATSAKLSAPWEIAIDTAGNVYIADKDNHCIRKITVSTGIISTIAGTGTAGFSGDNGDATNAELRWPCGLAFDRIGNLYIADYGNNRIRKIDKSTNIINSIAGTGSATYGGDGGPATAAQLHFPTSIAVDTSGNIYITDFLNHRIRKIDAGTGIINTIAGTGAATYGGDGGPATDAQLNFPAGVAVDPCGYVYIADYYNNRIRKISSPIPILTVSDPVTLCSGNSTILSVTGGSNYVWNPSVNLNVNTGETVIAQPNNTTNYTVSGACLAAATIKISVHSITANAGPDAVICFGSSTQLNASALSGEVAYQWNPDYALSSTIGNSIYASPTVTTPYSLIVTDAYGCTDIDSVTVNVSTSLTGNAGMDIILCNGNSSMLHGSGGSDYVWSPSEGLNNASIFNPIANPTVTTDYTLNAYSGACPTLPDIVTVEVNPFIEIQVSGNVSICPGGETNLTATGASSCTWSPATGLNSISGISVIASPTLATTYSVNGTNDCGSSVKEVKVQIRSNPSLTITGNKIVCKGDTTTLSAHGAQTYSWYPSTDLDTTAGPLVYASPTINTPYFLTGVDVYGCEGTTHITIVVDPCTGIEENIPENLLMIYPNPSTGKFFIQLDSQQAGNYKIKIMDMVGNTIFNSVIPAKAGISQTSNIRTLYEIDLSSQPKGIYFVKILNEDGEVNVRKVVVK